MIKGRTYQAAFGTDFFESLDCNFYSQFWILEALGNGAYHNRSIWATWSASSMKFEWSKFGETNPIANKDEWTSCLRHEIVLGVIRRIQWHVWFPKRMRGLGNRRKLDSPFLWIKKSSLAICNTGCFGFCNDNRSTNLQGEGDSRIQLAKILHVWCVFWIQKYKCASKSRIG